jgi:GNAT superfamily N-acetyltransferase
MADPEVIIRPVDYERDAEKLAAMWNASDLAWPATFTRGVPLTAKELREWPLEARFVAGFVAEVDGQIVGYCDFIEGFMDREGEGYLPLLGVHPKYHGHSIGRRLIQATIDYSVKVGWPRQTLNTWAANFKAVPAYKKTGHFWTPDTAVWMQNFIPGALQLSLAKPFFERHDWYACYVRGIKQEEDDQRWEGLEVYTEHWKADDQALTIWIDRETRAPVGVETDELLVAAIPAETEPLAGSMVDLRYRVVNKRGEPLRVYLHALGGKGLGIDHRAAFEVAPGATYQHVVEVQVADDAPWSVEYGDAPAVRSILRLNDQEVELFPGIRARKPLSLDTAPGKITLAPGIAGTISLQLHSELKQGVQLSLLLTLPEGMDADWMKREVELPVEGYMSVPLTLTASAEAVYSLPVRVTAAGKDGPKPFSEVLTVFSLGPGGLLAQRQGGAIRLETDALRVSMEAREGTVNVEGKANHLRIASTRPALGRPYRPSDLRKVDFDLSLEMRGSRAVVHMTAEPRGYPGLLLHQEFALSATGLGTFRCYLENRGDTSYTRRLRFGVGTSDRQRERMTIPLKAGLVQSMAADYPVAWQDAPPEPDAYAEPWLAWEREGAFGGIAWDRSITRVNNQWQIGLDSEDMTVAPGQRSSEVRFALHAGRGDWRRMREAALRWAGLPLTDLEPTMRPPAVARVEPEVLATVAEEAEARLVVDTLSNRATSGKAWLHAEGSLVVEPVALPVADLVRGKPLGCPVHLGLPKGRLGVFRGTANLELPLSVETRPFAVARLGTSAPVTVAKGMLSGQPVWTIDNGLSSLVVAPEFGPSMIAWEQDGANQLWSAFPKPQGLSWIYPWFGGLGASMNPVGVNLPSGAIYRDRFAAQAIDAPGPSGLPWRGVRLSAQPARKELRDLAIEVDYLTLGESNVLKLVYRVCNLRATERAVGAGISLACRLGAEPVELDLVGEGITHSPAPWFTMIGEQRWGALVNPRSGKAMLLVGRQADVLLADWGQYGRTLGSGSAVQLAESEVRELVYYLVLADSLAQAKEYLVLERCSA